LHCFANDFVSVFGQVNAPGRLQYLDGDRLSDVILLAGGFTGDAYLDTIEVAAKYVFLQQAASMPVNVTFRGGADWRTERDLDDRSSLFAQAILSRRMGKLEVFALPTFATNAGRAVSGDRSVALFEHAFNVPVGAAYFFKPPVAIVAELIPPNGDLPNNTHADLGWALGIKRAIGGHWFEILLTNNQSTMADQYVTSTYQGAPLDAGDVRLGFNIERRFGRRK